METRRFKITGFLMSICIIFFIASCVGGNSVEKQDDSAIHIFPLKNQEAIQILVSEDSIYYVTSVKAEKNKIYRLPFEENEAGVFITSTYANGHVNLIRPTHQGEWLVFIDFQDESNLVWKLMAVNIKSKATQILDVGNGDTNSWPGPFVDVYFDKVVWTVTRQSINAGCVQTMILLVDLSMDTTHEIDKACVNNNYMWVFPRLFDQYLVVEQDLPEMKDSANNIYLFDLTKGKKERLTENGRSSMPSIWFPWIAWKASPRFSFGMTELYHLENQQITAIPNSLREQDRLEARISSGWVYWEPTALQPLYVYNTLEQKMITVIEPGINEHIIAVSMFEDIIAWSTDLDFEHSHVEDSTLSWMKLH